MRLSYFCFLTATLAALTGMSMGIAMGMSENFSIAPAHAHLNLLGWVTMALYGLYHRGIERPSQRLAWVQVLAGAAGFCMMAGGLAVYLGLGDERAMSSVIVGSLLCLLSMSLFAVIIVTDLRRVAVNTRVSTSTHPQRAV